MYLIDLGWAKKELAILLVGATIKMINFLQADVVVKLAVVSHKQC